MTSTLSLESEIQYVKGCLSGYKNALFIVQTLSEDGEDLIRAIERQIRVEESIIENLEKQNGRIA